MRITILVVGTRGDLQPFLALGLGLKRTGYMVKIATHDVYRDLVEGYELEFATLEGNPRQLMEQQSGQSWQESGSNPLEFLLGLRKLAYESMERNMADTVLACQDSDAIIFSVLSASGYHVSEQMGIPSIYGLLQPISRTREFPSITMPLLPLGGGYNYLTHIINEQLLWQMFRVSINRWRRETLDLDPMPFSGPFQILLKTRHPVLFGFSEHVIPRPADWPPWQYITGYWRLESEKWSPPESLVDFLADGTKPISIGFGSMSGEIAQQLLDVAIEAISLTGGRAILLGGWTETHQQDFPESIYTLDSAPHDWLFPRMTAVVHHGGAGTTAAGLHAGIPSIVVPFFGDQPYWGHRVHALGVGPEPIPRRRLTPERLASVFDQVITDEGMHARAVGLGEKLRAEDGVAKAVEIIERTLI